MEKRLRRARTVAIVLAVVFYLLTKLAYLAIGNEFRFSALVLPVLVFVFEAFLALFEYGSDSAVTYLTMALSGLGLTALSLTVAYAINAMLRVDAD